MKRQNAASLYLELDLFAPTFFPTTKKERLKMELAKRSRPTTLGRQGRKEPLQSSLPFHSVRMRMYVQL